MAHAHYMLDTYGYKYTHSGCVLIIAFPQQQWLHVRASLLRLRTLPLLLDFWKMYETFNGIL